MLYYFFMIDPSTQMSVLQCYIVTNEIHPPSEGAVSGIHEKTPEYLR